MTLGPPSPHQPSLVLSYTLGGNLQKPINLYACTSFECGRNPKHPEENMCSQGERTNFIQTAHIVRIKPRSLVLWGSNSTSVPPFNKEICHCHLDSLADMLLWAHPCWLHLWSVSESHLEVSLTLCRSRGRMEISWRAIKTGSEMFKK